MRLLVFLFLFAWVSYFSRRLAPRRLMMQQKALTGQLAAARGDIVYRMSDMGGAPSLMGAGERDYAPCQWIVGSQPGDGA